MEDNKKSYEELEAEANASIKKLREPGLELTRAAEIYKNALAVLKEMEGRLSGLENEIEDTRE